MNGYDDAEDYSTISDNPPTGIYDPYPDTTLGAEDQEALGRSIVQETQRGIAQEELGRGIVQESLGKSILDQLLSQPENTQPWFKGVDGSLAGTAKVMGQITRLLGRPDATPTDGGLPVQLGSQPYFGPTGDGSRRYTIAPTNTTRDGRTGTMAGGTINGIFGPIRRTATGTGSIEFGGSDFLFLGLGLVGAYAAYRAVRAFL